jgi:predicted DNA binding protein
MWTLKFKSKEEWNIYNSRTIKFGINLQFYSRNYYVQGREIYFINSGIALGEDKSKKQFFSDLKKDKKIKDLEINNDFFVSVYYESLTSKRVDALKNIYNQKIIFLKPAFIDKKGWEEWEIASFNREDLEKILKIVENVGKENFKLIYFKEQKIKDLMIYSILPDLTDQQKTAFNLAVEAGYYGYPRKIKLVDLARRMSLSLSTFQFHLAKAEAKLMPFFSKKL